MRRKLAAVLLAVVTASASWVSPATAAGAADQPVEWAGNPKATRWGLTSWGQGWQVNGDKCDNSDYVMVINKRASADPERFRIYSSNRTVQNAFSGKSPIGHNLYSTNTPYLCLGWRDTQAGGGPGNVARNLFVWVN